MELNTILSILILVFLTVFILILLKKKPVEKSIPSDYAEIKERIKQLDDDKLSLSVENSRLKTLSDTYEKEKNAANESKRITENELLKKQSEINSLIKEKESLTVKLQAKDEKLSEQKKEIENIHETSKIEFKNIANEIFKENTETFNKNNSDKMDDILKPFKENLGDLKKKVEETYEKEAREKIALQEQIKLLLEQTNKISEEANSLASVLKGDKKIQGNWGEKMLETILEKSGLIKNTHYDLQPTIMQNKRPDAIVYLPEQRVIIIDSKVSLVNYVKYYEAEETDVKKNYLKQYKVDVDNQINNLSSKEYDKEMSDKSLDFMIMLFPVEAAYLTLIQEFGEIWNEAYNKRILLVSPTNLIACSKLIESLWRREQISKNAMEIVRVGTSLYDKFVGFGIDIIDVGKSLDNSKQSYEEAVKKLNTGKGNIVRIIDNLKKLGIKSEKQIPENLLKESDDSDYFEILPNVDVT